MNKVKEALKNKEEKNQNITISKGYMIKQLIIKMKDEIKNKLPENISYESFQNTANQVFSNDPNFEECDPVSFIDSLIEGLSLDLEINSLLGQAYLIPNKSDNTGKVGLQIGYRGLIELAYRSAKLKNLYAVEVRENDEFDIDYGIDPKLTHKPLLRGDRGEVIGYYAVYNMEGAYSNFLFMSLDEVREHGKKYSKNYSSGLWKSEFEEMAKKTVIKRLLKYAPLSIKEKRAIFLEDIKDIV